MEALLKKGLAELRLDEGATPPCCGLENCCWKKTR